MLHGHAWPRVLPFLVYMGFVALADLLGRLGWSDAALRWLYPVKIAAVLGVLLYYRRRYSELRLPPLTPLMWRWLVVALLTGVAVLVLWIHLDAPWMSVGTPSGFDPRTNGVINWPLVALRIAGAALVVPVMEELFWRSFLMRWLASPDFLAVQPAVIKWKPFVITVILFGFEHNLWLAGIVAGAAYSVLYMRGSSLWLPILAHLVTNFLLGVWIVFASAWTYW